MSTAIRDPHDLARLMGIAFSDQQLAAITAPMEPGLVVAGAGTGKTTVMAARVVWLVGSGQVPAERVLGLTFTTKAAGELARRVRDYLAKAGLVVVPDDARGIDDAESAAAAEPTVLTYHAYAARLLAEHGLRIGIEPDTRVISDATRFQLAAAAVRRFEGAVDHLTTWMPTTVKDLLALDAELSEHLVSPAEVREFQRREAPLWADAKRTKPVQEVLKAFDKRTELLAFVERYRDIKTQRGVMDFADQMAGAARLAEAFQPVGAAERERFCVVLLDEYQDTSVAQARLLRALFADSVDEAGLGHPVAAVGDPCQAIYGWRGASVGNIEQFGAHFQRRRRGAAAPALSYPLTVNRRSQRTVLQAANHLAAPLYSAFRGARPLAAAVGVGDGTARLAVLETYRDELEFLAAEVPRAHDERARTWSEIAVLARDNKSVADIHDALVGVDVPVEVVGLSGLLQMPEVIEIVATLEVLSDVTANAALLALLTGPRWAIGARDLALLGKRARALARTDEPPPSPGGADGEHDVAQALAAAVSGVDPADLVSLVEALGDPGALPYSSQARERFRSLSRELDGLRRYVGEPLIDLVRRVVDGTGLEVELASSTSPVAAARRNNLATFLDAVSAFAGVDADSSLAGLLAYLEAEDDYGQGLPLALPSAADSVKLLTAHRAKGLEWDVVFAPGWSRGVFPVSRAATKWTASPAVLPTPLRGDAADLPAVAERSPAGLATYATECSAATETEERRLAYVCATRPREQLVVSCHWWGPQQVRRRGPSVFAEDVRAALAGVGSAAYPDVPAPADDAVNPANAQDVAVPWPTEAGAHEVERRHAAAALVEQARQQGWRAAAESAADELMLDEQAVVRQWDLELEALLEEARTAGSDEVVVTLPPAISATMLLRLGDDPAGLARALARPMPRKPSAAARFGTRFHAWVESYVGQPLLLDPDDLPGRADMDISGDDELRELIEAFRSGPYGGRIPVQVEAPFALVLGGHVVRGRIDAVYADADGGFDVVDWKTNQSQTADPLQLATYRLAWAELTGVPVEHVTGSFYYVRSGEVVSYDDLPGRADLERLV
ncbi:MAG: UvrD-helicase domain-containing protein, partial [Nocardioidaceae bacterium]